MKGLAQSLPTVFIKLYMKLTTQLLVSDDELIRNFVNKTKLTERNINVQKGGNTLFKTEIFQKD